MISKVIRILVRTNKRKERTQINRIRNEQGSITYRLKKFRIRACFKNLCSTRLESLKGVDNFIEAVKPPKLNQRSYQPKQILTNKETEILIKKLLAKKKKSLESEGFTVELYQPFEKTCSQAFLSCSTTTTIKKSIHELLRNQRHPYI